MEAMRDTRGGYEISSRSLLRGIFRSFQARESPVVNRCREIGYHIAGSCRVKSSVRVC